MLHFLDGEFDQGRAAAPCEASQLRPPSAAAIIPRFTTPRSVHFDSPKTPQVTLSPVSKPAK